jgi:hypothetical protein
VGGDKGEGDVSALDNVIFTLTPTLSHSGRGSLFDFLRDCHVSYLRILVINYCNYFFISCNFQLSNIDIIN